MKKILLFLVLVILAFAASFYVWNGTMPDKEPKPTEWHIRNISYEVNGRSVLLVDGRAEVESAPGSASKTVTQYFGNGATTDLNGDGENDVVFLLTQDGGGSGTFYYAVAALKSGVGYRGTNAIFLGDRIAPQSTDASNRLITINYADRKPNEPMTAAPSLGVTKYLAIDDGKLSELFVDNGYVTMAHEVRIFKPCGEKKELWIEGSSPAYKEILSSYERVTAASTPSSPSVNAVLVGKRAGPPIDGFGADYEGSYIVFKLINMAMGGSCE